MCLPMHMIFVGESLAGVSSTDFSNMSTCENGFVLLCVVYPPTPPPVFDIFITFYTRLF